MNFIKKLLLVPTSLIILFFVTEVFLRLLPFVATATLTQPINKTSPIAHFKPNHKFIFSLGWNGKLFVEHTTNSYGFSTPIEFHKDQVANCIIGDSYVEALQIKPEKSFHGILTNLGFTVYPFGKSTHGLSDYIVSAKWALNNFNCQKIIFMITDNDFVHGNIKGPGLHYFDYANNGNIEIVPYAPSTLKKILRRSALFNYLYRNLRIQEIKRKIYLKFFDDLNYHYTGTRRNMDVDKVDKDTLKQSYLVIDYFFKKLENINIDYENILIILDGDRLRTYNESNNQESLIMNMNRYIIEKCKDNKIKFIDLHSVFESDFSKNKKKFNFPFDYHWNEYGHYVVANQIEKSNFLILQD